MLAARGCRTRSRSTCIAGRGSTADAEAGERSLLRQSLLSLDLSVFLPLPLQLSFSFPIPLPFSIPLLFQQTPSPLSLKLPFPLLPPFGLCVAVDVIWVGAFMRSGRDRRSRRFGWVGVTGMMVRGGAYSPALRGRVGVSHTTARLKGILCRLPLQTSFIEWAQ